MNKELAFVFPGQGSQQVGMLADLAESYPVIKATFEEASSVLGYDLWDLIQNDEAGQLNQTDKTQPALLTASVALWRLWSENNGAEPAYVAGHSLGEYSALVCAGVIKFADAVNLVRLRGEYMQQAIPAGEGAMAAIIGLGDDVVVENCRSVDGIVSAVNFNSPGQVVIAGHTQAVEQAIEKMKESGAKRALPLPVSVPSHCELMIPAGEKLAKDLENIEFSVPTCTLIQNVSAQAVSDPAELKANLVAQLSEPVLWTQSVELLSQLGVTKTIECGPGKVLSGLNKRIVKGLEASSIADKAGFDASIAANS